MAQRRVAQGDCEGDGESSMIASFEDLTTKLNDCLDDLAVLRKKQDNPELQYALRVEAGFYLMQMVEGMDQMDYEYALLVCEIGPDIAAEYRSIYYGAVRQCMEAQV